MNFYHAGWVRSGELLGGFALNAVHWLGSRLIAASLRPEIPGWKAKLNVADS